VTINHGLDRFVNRHVCLNVFCAGLPDFTWHNLPKRENYPTTIKQTKWQQNILNSNKICQMATKYIKWQQNVPNGQHLPFQDPPKFTQIWIFGLKIYCLATLLHSSLRLELLKLFTFSFAGIFAANNKSTKMSTIGFIPRATGWVSNIEILLYIEEACLKKGFFLLICTLFGKVKSGEKLFL
jgi:hypothetical protein